GASIEEAVYSSGLTKDQKLIKVLDHCETTVLQKSDGLIFVSHAMKRYYAEKGCSDRYAIIPCATTATFEGDNKRRGELRRELGLDGKFVLCYAGSAAPYQLVDVMCKLFRKVRDRYSDAFFLVISHHVEAFAKSLEEAGVTTADYKLTAVEHERVFELL